ncbi:MAG: DUF3343 domain-containing protein [Oscillospiraceae bacterium]|nr:DUF3343 domain-containing protein [Oscillospiraceae bacterium]
MKYTLLAVSSITYAMKAKKLLNGMGIFCEVSKTPKNLASGCGYSVRIRDNPDYVAGILEKNGIAVKDRGTVEM